MKPVKQAHRYAKALLRNIGIENAPQALTELMSVNELMVKSREFRSLLENPRFTPDERAGIIKAVSERLKLSESTVKFILHISEVGVIVALSDIIRIATTIYLERKKKAKAVVMTPITISRDRENTLKASLKRLTDRDVELEYIIDPSLFGDFRVLMRGLIATVNRRLDFQDVAVQLENASEADAAAVQDYLRKYFERANINVFWGGSAQFIAELREQWEANR